MRHNAERETAMECPRCGKPTPVARSDLVDGRSVECRRCAGEVVVTHAEGEESPGGWILTLSPDEQGDE